LVEPNQGLTSRKNSFWFCHRRYLSSFKHFLFSKYFKRQIHFGKTSYIKKITPNVKMAGVNATKTDRNKSKT